MALSRVKTWNAAETLTASDLNAEFNNICNHFGALDNDDINSTATFTMGELIVGSGITSADGGQLHVHTASAGTIQAVADADEAVFENSAAAGITILSGTSSTGMIAFGDSGDADIGKISYSHSTNGYTITANAATALQISSAGAVTTGGSVLSDTDSTDSLGSASVRWANLYVDSIGDTGQALAITAGTNAINLTAGDVTLYDDNNNADTSISMGTSATEALVVQALNGGSNKTLEELRLTTKTASGTADHGKVTVYVDEAHIADVDDSGINLASGKTFRINGTNVVASAGDFSGPGSATDNAVVRFDGTGGKTAQNSGVTIDDSNNATGFANLTLSGELDAATGDFSGDVDVDGTLETDALTIGGTTLLANDTNNRVTTATGSGTLNGEANLTFDGSTLTVTADQHITAGKALVVGGTTQYAAEAIVTPEVQVLGANRASASMLLAQYTADDFGPSLYFMKSRNASIGGNTVVQDGDQMGSLLFYANDGTDGHNLGAAIRANIDGTPGSNDTPGRLVFFTAADGSNALVERMRINSGGTVLIPTVNGSPSLDLGGAGTSNALISTPESMYFSIDSNNDQSDRGYYFGHNANTTSATVLMTIRDSGNVGIGHTSPSYRLHVVGDNSGWLSEFRNDHSSSPYGLTLYWPNAAPDNNTNLFLNCQDSGAARAKIYADGDVWTSDAGTLTSDERLKTNIVDATSKLADVMRLRVRNFEWAPEYHPNKVGEKKIGFIAQELEEVFPSLVSEHDVAPDNSIQEQLYTEEDDTQYYVDGDEIPDGKEIGDVKAESQIPEGKEIGDVKVEAKAHEPTMRKSYKNAFAPILVKALQEVTTRLEAAEAKIAALEEA